MITPERVSTMRRTRTTSVAFSLWLVVMVAGCGGGTGEEPAGEEPAAEVAGDAEAMVTEGIVCDRFELRWELDGTDLLLAIDTDLPDEGELSVTVNRIYYEVGSDAAYSRDYFSEFEPVSRWREPRRVALDADAWNADLAAFQNEMAALGADLAFEVARIEDSIQIRAVLHINQDDPRFGGSGNPSLSGEATNRMGERVLVEAEASVEFPLDGPPPSSRSTRAPYAELEALVTGASSEQVRLQAANSLVDRSVGRATERIQVAAAITVQRPW